MLKMIEKSCTRVDAVAGRFQNLAKQVESVTARIDADFCTYFQAYEDRKVSIASQSHLSGVHVEIRNFKR